MSLDEVPTNDEIALETIELEPRELSLSVDVPIALTGRLASRQELESLIFGLYVTVYRHPVATEYVREENKIHVPVSWWQHFKMQVLGMRGETKTIVQRTVVEETKVCFPEELGITRRGPNPAYIISRWDMQRRRQP